MKTGDATWTQLATDSSRIPFSSLPASTLITEATHSCRRTASVAVEIIRVVEASLQR